MNVYGGVEAYLICNTTDIRVSDFKGGVATLSIPFTVPNGLKAERFRVWYAADDGATEKLETWYEESRLCWSVGHFSDFVFVYENEETSDMPTSPQTPISPQTGDYTNPLIWILPIAVSLFLLIFGKEESAQKGEVRPVSLEDMYK